MIPAQDHAAKESRGEHAANEPGGQARADLHCHSTASQLSKLGIQRSAGLPECATPPEEVYELAKRRGMDFVTISDHDTIDGVLQIADRPDVFISEELTAWFAGEDRAVHILCMGITPGDHEWLQAHSRDLEACAAYLADNQIACALAHPFYSVEAPLTPRHRKRLAELFAVWEVRNGSRAPELNHPALVYTETREGTGVGGSDDHAGVDVGRTWTQTPAASTPEEFLAHIRAGRAAAHGDQGSAAKWAHAAIALAVRAHLLNVPGGEEAVASAPGIDPASLLRMSRAIVEQGQMRRGEESSAIGPGHTRGLLRDWIASIGVEGGPRGLLELMQDESFDHADLARRCRHVHERRLRDAVDRMIATVDGLDAGTDGGEALNTLFEVFAATIPVAPYAPSQIFLSSEKMKLAAPGTSRRRVALIVDGAGSMHGVTHTLHRIRELGVPGWEVEVVGTDPGVDRRLPAVSEVEVPFYPGMAVGVPAIPGLVDTLAEGRYDLVHTVSPGPAGALGMLVAKIAGVPIVGSYHTEFVSYAAVRSGSDRIEAGVRAVMSLFYGQCRQILSPTEFADRSVAALGIEPERIARWARGVDQDRFDPAKRDPGPYPGEVKILYAGRQTKEKGIDLLIDAFKAARRRNPHMHLLLAGGGPEQATIRSELGRHATVLGWLEGDELARAYASADAFLFCSRTDTFGQVVVEAQASGLPVVAVGEGGPVSLIEDGRSGLLRDPDPEALATALCEVTGSPLLRTRLIAGGLQAAAARTWEGSMRELGAGYAAALGVAPADRTDRFTAALRSA